ncbi:hypothetical protein [Candidatus Lokiarchaeum ossiferum]|uniref:hypothetical protein n=1 Tax=Candidatus Lokiarchaeum ossiferum TaxID=2951803 RepID=UPI00352D1A87
MKQGNLSRYVNIKVGADTTSAVQDINSLNRDQKAVDKEIDSSRVKLAAYWSYGNQIANMLMTQLSKVSENAKYQAVIQTVQSGLQIAQSEVAIAQTVLQSQAAFATNNPISGILLASIAMSMQVLQVQNMVNQATAKRNERNSEELARQLESYI